MDIEISRLVYWFKKLDLKNEIWNFEVWNTEFGILGWGFVVWSLGFRIL